MRYRDLDERTRQRAEMTRSAADGITNAVAILLGMVVPTDRERAALTEAIRVATAIADHEAAMALQALRRMDDEH